LASYFYPLRIYFLLIWVVGSCVLASPARADALVEVQPNDGADHQPTDVETLLADSIASLIESAIPTEYNRRKDWGARKNLTTGLKIGDSGLSRRKRPVKHGTWKRYAINIPNPEENLSVRVASLRPTSGNEMGLTLVVNADLNTLARAKIYQYGVHIIALEMEADTTVELTIDCTVGIEFTVLDGKPAIKVAPHVTAAELDLKKFRLRRISSANGPLVKELGDGIQRAIEKELDGDTLVKRLNRSIQRKGDRLTIKLTS